LTKKVKIDLGGGLKEYDVLDVKKAVELYVSEMQKELRFNLMSYVPREEFDRLRKEWHEKFGEKYLGKTQLEKAEEAAEFWMKKGYKVSIGRDPWNIMPKIFKGFEIKVYALPRKSGGYFWTKVLEKPAKKATPVVLKASTRQTGKRKSLKRDKKRKALPPGKRKSKTGKIYYEYRRNRSDVKKKIGWI